MYNPKESIPAFIHDTVMDAMGVSQEEYDSYLKTLENEAKTYIAMRLVDEIKLTENQEEIAIGFYVEYTLFSKMNTHEVAKDKIDSLDGLLRNMNSKYREKKQEAKTGLKVLVIL